MELNNRPHIVFSDKSAWMPLARGEGDKSEFPRENVALKKGIEQVKYEAIMVPLTFANIYETTKINDPVRRANMARTQALISDGMVFRGRRRILGETLADHIAGKLSIPRPAPEKNWFLSDLWRSEEHTSELQSLMRISYAVFCLKKKKKH